MINKNVKAIYTVTTIKKNNPDLYTVNDWRCFGWYADYETAEERVINNESDICESYYNYAVIEKAYEGFYGTSYSVFEEHGQDWFKFNKETEKYEHIETPEWAWHRFGWGIG